LCTVLIKPPVGTLSFAACPSFLVRLLTTTSVGSGGHKQQKVQSQAMEILKERMPHVDFTKLDNGRSVDQLSEVFTVASLVDFVQRKTAS
ncbi:MAG: hypothetical protein QMB94_12030, partial [Phycisphaerales bacterium]